MIGIVPHHVVLSRPVSILKVQLEEILTGRAGDIAHGERILLDLVERLPHVEESDTSRQKILSLIFEELANAKRTRLARVIAMHQTHSRALRRVLLILNRLREILSAGIGLGADGVVEDLNSLRSLGLLQELHDLGVELLPNQVFVAPFVVGEVGGEVVDFEALFVDGEFALLFPSVVDLHFLRVIARFVDFAGFIGFVEVQLRSVI